MDPLSSVKELFFPSRLGQGLLTVKFPRDKKFMLPTDPMTLLFRLLLVGLVSFAASHLAAPEAIGAELGLGGDWNTPEPLATGDIATPQVESDPWADSFLPTPGAPAGVKIEPVKRPSAAPLVSTPSSPQRVSSYQIQQNDQVLRFLGQFQTGYRRAVRRGCPRSWCSPR